LQPVDVRAQFAQPRERATSWSTIDTIFMFAMTKDARSRPTAETMRQQAEIIKYW